MADVLMVCDKEKYGWYYLYGDTLKDDNGMLVLRHKDTLIGLLIEGEYIPPEYDIIEKPSKKAADGVLEKYELLTQKLLVEVEELFIANNVQKSHDINHIKRVLQHTIKGYSNAKITCKQKFWIRAAAILHDADDGKLFLVRASRPYQNAVNILEKLGVENIDIIIEMISYVSASKNRGAIPEAAIRDPWKLIPRLADIADAGGIEGVRRCYQYSIETNRPIYDEETPKGNVYEIATPERFASYRGGSRTMIDHYYDKLIQLLNYETENEYFLSIREELLKPLLNVLDLFNKGELTKEYLDAI